jgi:hypothetical protein
LIFTFFKITSFISKSLSIISDLTKNAETKKEKLLKQKMETKNAET